MLALLWLKNNWRLVVAGILLLASFKGGWSAKGYFAAIDKENALTAQETLLRAECEESKKITEEANNALQKNYDSINRKLAASKRLQSTCVMPKASGSAIPASGGREHAGQNGISSDWLREYAAECERYRSERTTLEEFESRVWGMFK